MHDGTQRAGQRDTKCSKEHKEHARSARRNVQRKLNLQQGIKSARKDAGCRKEFRTENGTPSVAWGIHSFICTIREGVWGGDKD